MSASSKKKLRKEQNAATMTEKQQKEMKEAKKLKTYTLTFAIVMILVVAIVIGVTVSGPIESAINRNTHAITIGDHKLSTIDLAYYYMDAVNEYSDSVYSEYGETWGNYWQMFLGFNADEPLNKQYQDKDKGITWAQYFVDSAIDSATTVYALYDAAMAKEHKLTDEEQKQIDLIEKNLNTLSTYYGYSNAEAYLRSCYGNGASVESYVNYCSASIYAESYVTAYSDSLEYTKDELREYEKDKYINYTSFDYCYYLLNVTTYLGEGTKDKDGNVTYTDEQKAAALAAAKNDADALVSSKATTAEAFNKAIQALTINKDNKNASCVANSKVFYENLGYVEIQEWLADENRKENEIEILPITTKQGEGDDAKEETSGYLVIIFQGRNDNLDNLVNVRHILAKFQGAYTDTDGNKHYTETGKKAAKDKAEKLLADWKAGKATEESFAELANKNSDDSDGTDGGLYEDIFPGQMVEAFNDWCFDKDRKPGDTGIVETEYGHHVMYFVETQDYTYRDYLIENDMNVEDSTEHIEELKKDVKVERVDLSGLDWDMTLA